MATSPRQNQIDHPPLARAPKRAVLSLTNEAVKVGEAYD